MCDLRHIRSHTPRFTRFGTRHNPKMSAPSPATILQLRGSEIFSRSLQNIKSTIAQHHPLRRPTQSSKYFSYIYIYIQLSVSAVSERVPYGISNPYEGFRGELAEITLYLSRSLLEIIILSLVTSLEISSSCQHEFPTRYSPIWRVPK